MGGPLLIRCLPFKCRSWQDSSQSDVIVAESKNPKDGKYEVVFPIGFPDEGTFDWLDGFLANNPHYAELSDRMIIDWAVTSGFYKKSSWKEQSNDRPDYNFGVPMMDDLSVRRVLNSIASVTPRNYVVMEVCRNLVAEDRRRALKKFVGDHFKRVARVTMGEPPHDLKLKVKDKLLKEKQAKSDAEWNVRKLEKERKKIL